VPSLQKQRFFRDSMLKYFAKWHPSWQYYLLKIVWPIGLFFTWLSVIFKIKGKNST